MAEKISVMVNGLPGRMATVVAHHVSRAKDLNLIDWSLTGPEIEKDHVDIDGLSVILLKPNEREEWIEAKKSLDDPMERFISVDFTHPSAVIGNAKFYCEHNLPFVMGTTGGDRVLLHTAVELLGNVAVIAPNMAKQIVGFQAMMEFAAENFPGLFSGYDLTIEESHQKGKADTSGTAKAMVGYFNKLGVSFTIDQIKKQRDPKVQQEIWGVPEEYLDGHGYHFYTLKSPDGTVTFQFVHEVNGRGIYASGTIDAINFLAKKVEEGVQGKVFTMIDVLKGV